MSKELPNHIQQRNQEVFTTTWKKFQEQQKEISPFADLKQFAARDLRNAKRVLRRLGEKVVSQIEQLPQEEQQEFLARYAAERQKRIAEERRANGHLGSAVRKGLIARNSYGVFDVDAINRLEYFQNNPHAVDIINTRQLYDKKTAENLHTMTHEHHHDNHSEPHHNDLHYSPAPHNHVHKDSSTSAYTEKQKPILSKWQRIVLLAGNGTIGLAELTTNVSSAMVDGAHCLAGDLISYLIQARNVRNDKLSEEQRERGRKISNRVIFGTNVVIGGLAVKDLFSDIISSEYISMPHPYVLSTAIASLGLNMYLISKTYPEIKRKRREGTATVYDEELMTHLIQVDTSSASLAVAGAVANIQGSSIAEHIAGAASGILGAYFFPFTPDKKPQACILHDHGDEDVHHHEEVPQQITQSKRKKIGTALAGIATVALLGGGVGAAKNMTESSEAQISDTRQTLILPKQQIPTEQQRVTDLPLSITEKIKIKKEDSQWKLAEEKIKDAGQKATIPLTNIIVDLTAFENNETWPTPDIIHNGEALTVPTAPVIEVIAEALNTPPSPHITTEEKEFIHDLQILNQQPDITKQEVVKKEKKRFQKIKNYLQTHFSYN